MLTAVSAGMTDTGRIRTNNEDAFLVAPPLYVVADGMGGAAAGEVASSMAIDILSGELGKLGSTDDRAVEQAIRSAVSRADTEISWETTKEPAYSGMGTTVVMAYQAGNRLCLANVGDSRAYLVSANTEPQQSGPVAISSSAETGIMAAYPDQAEQSSARITRLTEDHSVVMEMVASKVIEESDIRTHPMRNRITRCLGSIGNSEPDLLWQDITPGDMLLLCSDGLWEMMHEDLMLAIMTSAETPDEANTRLIEAANNAGGVDNITVVTVRFGE